MRIAYISAGAAGMYCGACLHDNTLAATLIRMGHDVALIPLYTPIRTDETDVSIDRVFYGAVNVYLEQKSALFRHTPWMFDRLLNRRGLLNWVSGKANSADAKMLGDLTLSVLQGEEGKQKKELDKLMAWLKDEYRPDMVQLSNSLFLGMANTIRTELGVPVICMVQGEEIFIDDLEEPYRAKVRAALTENSRFVDGFVASSSYYVDFMADYLRVPRNKMHQVPLGLNLDGYERDAPPKGELPFTIGYLARICPEKGLHLLVEAFRRITQQVGPEQVRLRIAGYLGERDREYFDGIMSQIQSWGLEGAVDHVGEVDREHKIDFLQSLHVLSVPTIYREPKGLFVLESMASGVPVVQPRHGAFPELIERTGGGLLVDSDSAASLAEGLTALMKDPARRMELGRKGRESIHRDYNAEVMAENTLEVYRKFVGGEPKAARQGSGVS
jgi:glycosyltransferase involved in cell wall biosynthesis